MPDVSVWVGALGILSTSVTAVAVVVMKKATISRIENFQAKFKHELDQIRQVSGYRSQLRLSVAQKLVEQRFSHVDNVLRLALVMENTAKAITGQFGSTERDRTLSAANDAADEFIAAVRIGTPYLTEPVTHAGFLLHKCARDLTVEALSHQLTTHTFTNILNGRRDLIEACKECIEKSPELADRVS